MRIVKNVIAKCKEYMEERRRQRFVGYLTDLKFDRIFKGKKLDDFYNFIREQAVPNKGFALRFQVTNGSLAWFRYEIRDDERHATPYMQLEEVYVPTEEDVIDRDVPLEIKGYPVWSVS